MAGCGALGNMIPDMNPTDMIPNAVDNAMPDMTDMVPSMPSAMPSMPSYDDMPSYGYDAPKDYNAGGAGGYAGGEGGYGGGESGYGGGGGYPSGPGYGPAPLPAPVPDYNAPLAQPVSGYDREPIARPVSGYDRQHPFPEGDDCEDCTQLVKSMKTVQVPCTRNTYRQYEVKVPRQVMEKIPRQVKYIDYEDRAKEVQYTAMKRETRYRQQQQSYMVPVTKKKTRMVCVTKKVPKTIYVDVTTQEPQEYTVVEQEARSRFVQIPYTVDVPETRTKIVNTKCPVEKIKVEYDNISRTIYDTQIKTECRPVTKLITKQVPVFEYRPVMPSCKPCEPVRPVPKPMPVPLPEPVVEEKMVVKTEYSAPKKYDANNDGVLDEEERKEAAAAGDLKVIKRQVVEEVGVDADEVNDAPVTYVAPKKFDANNDGILQENEARVAAAAGQLRRRPSSRTRRRSKRRSGSRSRSGSRGRSSRGRSSGRSRRRY